MLPILGNSQVINGKTYTPFNNFYKWRGGAFDTTLLIPQVASPNGKRAGAVYYNTPDSTVYTWTGTQWRKIGGASENNYTELIGGGKLSRNATLNRFTIGSATYYIQGQYYTSPFTQLDGFAKTPNINGRIDIVALGTTGPVIIQGTESPSPVSPTIATNRIKIGFVYYPPFDSLPTVSGNGIEAIFRKPGADSIFFSTSDTTLSIKDSIGISVAANGLTATGKTIKLGGSLTENTTIDAQKRIININNANIIFTDTLGNRSAEFLRTGISGGILGQSAIYGKSLDGNKIGRVAALGGVFAYTYMDAINNSTSRASKLEVFSDSLLLTGNAGRMNIASMETTTDTSTHKPMVYDLSTKRWKYRTSWPVSTPTLQQVTTAGNTTTDSINFIHTNNARLISLFKNSVGPGFRAKIKINQTLDTRSIQIEPTQIEFISSNNNIVSLIANASPPFNSSSQLPDSSGTLTQRVKFDGTTYNTGTNGVVDISGMWINGSATLDFGSTSAQNSADLTITVTGAATGDVVSLGVPNGSVNANTCFTAWVSATDTVTVRFNNYSSGAIDPASGTFKIKVFK